MSSSSRAALALVLASCATAPPAEEAPRGPPTVAELYPMVLGAAWAHWLTKADGSAPILVTSRIGALDDREVVFKSGDQEVRYERRPEGLFKPSSKYFLLRDPIAAGARWPMPEGEVRVTAIDAEVAVKAGRFRHCVIVEELGEGQRVEWVYARGVGPVRMRSFAIVEGTEQPLVEAELSGYRIEPASD